MDHRLKKIVVAIGCVTVLFIGAMWIVPRWTEHQRVLPVSTASALPNICEETPLMTAQKLAQDLERKLKGLRSFQSRKKALMKEISVQEALKTYPEMAQCIAGASAEEGYVLLLAAALGQTDSLFNGYTTLPDKASAIKNLAATLVPVERFYNGMGGILGYQIIILNLLANPAALPKSEQFFPPPSEDMIKNSEKVWRACYEGMKELPRTSCFFPLGGASDRLNLVDEVTKEPLPAAAFVFCGKSLFEWLMRDTQAVSYWHYRTFGRQVTIPIVIMTSHEKNNDTRVAAIGEAAGWFGQKQDSFFRMVQPLVMLVDSHGKWVVTSPLKLALKPGGHGVIWKLAQESGAFKWLQSKKVDVAIVRQINNPVAGLDTTVSSLLGTGLLANKSFGFASCPPKPGFAEGLNILSTIPKEGSTISNIEYTHFKTLQTKFPALFENESCPANTNVLYANIPAIEKALETDPIPGMLVNPKTCVEVVKNGVLEKKMAARLESCMQNIVDAMRVPIDPRASIQEQRKSLSTFLNLYDRKKLISVTKRAFQQGQSFYETPECCLFDLGAAMRVLLAEECQFQLPPEFTIEQFLQKGPEFTFTYHPALGPFWKVIGQKISHGTLAPGAEVELEIAELSCHGLTVDGSLRILAKHVVGNPSKDGSITYSDKVGRAWLKNCIILNKGIFLRNVEDFIKAKQVRAETCEIILEGFSEVVAENITIQGDFHLTVPDGKRAILAQDSSGKISVELEEIQNPSWVYKVNWEPTQAPKLSIEGRPTE